MFCTINVNFVLCSNMCALYSGHVCSMQRGSTVDPMDAIWGSIATLHHDMCFYRDPNCLQPTLNPGQFSSSLCNAPYHSNVECYDALPAILTTNAKVMTLDGSFGV